MSPVLSLRTKGKISNSRTNQMSPVLSLRTKGSALPYFITCMIYFNHISVNIDLALGDMLLHIT